jgi:hypothetical protein
MRPGELAMVGEMAAAHEGQPALADAVRPAWQGKWGWLLLGLLLLLEYALFREYAQREIAWAYPANNDQAVYLSYSHFIYEHILEHGLSSGIKYGLAMPECNGTMLPLQAALLYLVLGPSRLTALTVNFLYYALLQTVLVGTVRWYSGRWSIALLALGLLLATTTLHNFAGGLMDFRIDCVALCLFGIFISLAIRSRLFACWRWSAAAGAAAGLLVAFRFLTTLYLTGIFGSFFVVLCVTWYVRRGDLAMRQKVLRQMGGLVIAGAVLFVIAAPLVFRNLTYITDYYIGHITSGNNEIRNRQFGVRDTLHRLLYYPWSICKKHLGAVFFVLGGLLLGCALAYRRLLRPLATDTAPRLEPAPMLTCVFVTGCVLIPMTVLTLYGSPSPVVGSVVVAAVVWFVVLAALALAKLGSPQSSRPSWRLLEKGSDPLTGSDPFFSSPSLWLTILAAVILAKGFWTYMTPLCRHGWMSKHRADVEQVLELNDEILRRSRQLALAAPNVSCNFLSDYLPPWLQPSIYERHGVMFHNTVLMPGMDAHAMTEPEALAAIRKSDFVILNLAEVPEGADHPFRKSAFPFMQTIYEMRPQLLAECERYFDPVKHFSIFGDDVVLYMRKQASPGAMADGAAPAQRSTRN